MAFYYEQEPRYATLTDALQDGMGADTVKQLAVLVGLEKARRKADGAAQIVKFMGSDTNLKAVWAKLDSLQQDAVAETLYDEKGRFYADRFRAKYGNAPNWGKGYGYDSDIIGTSHGGFNTPMPSLLNVIIFHKRIIPDDLRARLLKFVKKPPPATLKVTAAIPAEHTIKWQTLDLRTRRREQHELTRSVTVRETARTAQTELLAALRLVDGGKIAVSDKTLQPGVASVRAFAGILSEADFYSATSATTEKAEKSSDKSDKEAQDSDAPGPIRAFAWPMLLQGGKLAELSNKKLELTKAGRKALGAPAAETLRTVWRNWIKTRVFDELRRVDNIKGQTGRGQKGLTGVANRRAAIVQALTHAPVGSWVKVDDFFRFIKAAAHDFAITRSPEELYISESGYGNLYENGSWLLMEGRYVLVLLFEYLATLGLLDVAYTDPQGTRKDYQNAWGSDDLPFFSRYDGLLYFRLTPLGSYALGLTDVYEPPPMSVNVSLTILPSLKINVHGTLTPDEEAILASYAERSDDPQSWHLSFVRTMETLETGRDIEELRDFLTARDDQELPETVEGFLLKAAKGARSLKDKGAARLIECADEATAEMLATHPHTARLCTRGSGKVLIVLELHADQFRAAVHVLGYALPR